MRRSTGLKWRMNSALILRIDSVSCEASGAAVTMMVPSQRCIISAAKKDNPDLNSAIFNFLPSVPSELASNLFSGAATQAPTAFKLLGELRKSVHAIWRLLIMNGLQ